jgi:hypothetical protein
MSMSPLTQKTIGFFSLISAILWILLSVGAIITSVTVVNDYNKVIQTEYKKIDSGLNNLQDKKIFGVFDPPAIWSESIETIDTGVNEVFSGISDGINFIKIILIVLPILIIVSQIMPLFLGIELLKQ